MTTGDRQRLMTKVARMYYEQGMLQPEIAAQLSMTQAMISRLLSAAEREGIVRTTVITPAGVYPELEDELERRFGLTDAIVADCAVDSREQILRDIGGAAASYLETTLGSDEVVGISSWNETLLRVVGAMQPSRRSAGGHVVQVLGGIGVPTAAVHSFGLTAQLASLLKAEPHFLPAPGVTVSTEAAALYLAEPSVAETLALFERLTIGLVGIGALEMIDENESIFARSDLNELSRLGAVGDICLRFFDDRGIPVESEFDQRVISLTLDQFKRVPRRVAVAGTTGKVEAIRAALEGRLVNILVTDRFTAERLLSQAGADATDRTGRLQDAKG